ncbi:hypothetical protein F5050DRAFT_1709814 [Lentinula boryana]|uniref:CCHC-type domain-containing protein n=1 Tax=Lentinula boryana TaxID=40481 RepID=A0ABQ8QLQ9_9AGAR|nr:hypothetical protein F5050DRAFT_1709814 [Lentinula boryana]
MSTTSYLPNLVSFPEDRQLVGIGNWAVFRDHLKSIARATGLTGYLDGTIVAPSPPAQGTSGAATAPTSINSRDPSVEEWELRDGRLAGIIYQNIRDPRLTDMRELSHCQSVNSLTNNARAVASLAKERIQQFRYTSGNAFEEYFKQLEALRKAASDVGCKIEDEDLRSQFLTSLSSDNLWIIQNHGSCAYPNLKRTLIEYDMMVESASPSGGNAIAHNALVANGSYGPNSATVCDNCRRTGHIKKNCWAKGGGNEGKGP